jgi:ribonuclease I
MLSQLIVMFTCLTVGNSGAVYNYYELAVQKWCSTDYMIHGLWPQINSTSYPENCKSVSYTQPVGELLTNMNTYWHGCDDTLWEHEWKKHGSCMQVQNNINEDAFFNTTLSLFLENKNLLKNCKDDDCILGCFDLDYNLIEC